MNKLLQGYHKKSVPSRLQLTYPVHRGLLTSQ